MGYVNSVLSNPAFQVFLIAMIGYIIGRIKIKGIEVGDAGILIVSLIAGHFGVTCPSFAKSIGIVLFVASVGLIPDQSFFIISCTTSSLTLYLAFALLLPVDFVQQLSA